MPTRPSTRLCIVVIVAVVIGAFFEWSLPGNEALPQPPLYHEARANARAVPPPPPKPYEFPAGGRKLSGAYRITALYGSPDTPALGALGDQPIAASVDRIRGIAAAYQPLSAEPVLPAFEIIATVASATPTENGDYSRETDAGTVLAWAQEAEKAGIYVVLDLQPGRSDFLSQAKLYEAALKLPNVGLALDPEWRLGPSQRPLEQIGSAGSAEVNAVSAWLAGFTKQHDLPQKLFVLHQFRFTMLPDRQNIDTSHPELAYVIQMDGQGTQPAKHDTWRSITAGPPPATAFGWKNFYHQDSPLLDPAGTMSIDPKPWYISYQ